jgi:lipopolysaccharide export system permease protein
VLSRHLVREFLWVFALTLAAFIAIYLIADFFDRLDTILKHEPSLGTVVRLFAYRIPLVVAQATPFAVLVGGLMGLGLLARHNEFVALRACGVSIWQIAFPLLAVGALVSVALFAWNETIVPFSARRWQTIREVEIKGREAGSFFAGREVWYHGMNGFYNIERIAPRRHSLLGLTVYQLNDDFRPRRIVEIETARWNGHRWAFSGARTRDFADEGSSLRAGLPRNFVLPETFDDFRVVSLDAEELSYGMLRKQIKALRRKGVDASESWVDLHLKLALPAASFLMVLVAVPLATRGSRTTSLAVNIGRGLVVGFSYFVVVAFTRALGQSGTLPPIVAAWSANVLFGLIGGYYLLGAD